MKSQKNENKEKDMENSSRKDIVENTPRSKCKPSNQKRDAAKRKLYKEQEADQEKNQEKSVNSGKEQGVEENQQGQINSSYQTRILTPPPRAPPDKYYGKCQVNAAPLIDKYEVINSEDEVERYYQYGDDLVDDDETSNAIIRAFSPQNDKDLEEDVHQVTQNQGLSPRIFKHEKFHFETRYQNVHCWQAKCTVSLL
ncbi:hypothetical protein EJD97_016937 [Solanum chilense]|uniref:Uncharacterized protein n=1 Tax=Solanum chilense TaxID=4083 RepID=A0A6N2B6Q0_SOLCI|nr:hypothetical protein EJD97_016937 [Solanum chilense]